MMIDLDHFKKINDNLGHVVGDEVLIEFAAFIESYAKQKDLFGRWGGEEFILVCPSTDLDTAKQFAEELRAGVYDHSFNHSNDLSCSIGLAQYDDQESASDLIRRADQALYRAKSKGRNRVELAI